MVLTPRKLVLKRYCQLEIIAENPRTVNKPVDFLGLKKNCIKIDKRLFKENLQTEVFEVFNWKYQTSKFSNRKLIFRSQAPNFTFKVAYFLIERKIISNGSIVTFGPTVNVQNKYTHFRGKLHFDLLPSSQSTTLPQVPSVLFANLESSRSALVCSWNITFSKTILTCKIIPSITRANLMNRTNKRLVQIFWIFEETFFKSHFSYYWHSNANFFIYGCNQLFSRAFFFRFKTFKKLLDVDFVSLKIKLPRYFKHWKCIKAYAHWCSLPHGCGLTQSSRGLVDCAQSKFHTLARSYMRSRCGLHQIGNVYCWNLWIS